VVRGDDGVFLIGIDCAAKKSAEKIGLALGWCEGNAVRIEEVRAKMKWDAVIKKLTGWILAAESRGDVCLLALDAPLGWPVALRSNLRCHKAGKPLKHSLDDADKLFFRQTDLEMKDCYKTPLAVGADRIARTAHAALGLLGELREKTGENIGLAWTPGMPNKSQAIEVYPVATLIAHLGKGAIQDVARVIKKKNLQKKEEANRQKREAYLQQIASKICFDAETKQKMIDDGNVFDAVRCVLAAADFVRGDVVCPTDCALAKKEGWIWVRPNRNHVTG